MALIVCPECGKKVSSLASSCPDCGYPISSAITSGTVSIKIGDILYVDNRGLTNSIVYATTIVQLIDSSSGKLLGEGKIGSIIQVHLEEPKQVTLKIKGRFGSTLYEGTIKPKSRYEITKLPALLKGKWALNEIDVIDSGF